MPLIHKGDSTRHQDQAITPVSLSTISAGSERTHRSWPRFQIHAPADPGRLCRNGVYLTSAPSLPWVVSYARFAGCTAVHPWP
jgi:hypothetical protein